MAERYYIDPDDRVRDNETMEFVEMNPEDAMTLNAMAAAAARRGRRWNDGMDDDLARETGEYELDACKRRALLTGDDWGAIWPVRAGSADPRVVI